MNKKILFISILLILVFLVVIISYIFIYKWNQNNLSLKDYTENTTKYLNNLNSRLQKVNYSENNSENNDFSELLYKLKYIDGMYKEGLINASVETYYLLEKNCKKKICFSVRETYLFNFNYPLYEW